MTIKMLTIGIVIRIGLSVVIVLGVGSSLSDAQSRWTRLLPRGQHR